MKILLILLVLLPAAAFSGTIDLPLPTIAHVAPASLVCTWTKYAHPHTIVTGFNATGNYVLGTADDVAVCGSSGHSGNIRYYPYCASFVWDLSGNLVSTTIGTCTRGNAYASYTNAGGYTAYTFLQLDYGYIQYEYPVLEAP